MMNKPAEYKINWVRVYQDKNDPKQKVGCSTEERPTRRFIEAHEKKYKKPEDVSHKICVSDMMCFQVLKLLQILIEAVY